MRARDLWRAAAVPLLHRERVLFPELRLHEPAENQKWQSAWERIQPQIGTGATLILCGPRGTGKTQLATLAIASACLDGRPSRYVTARRMFAAIKGTFRRESTTSEDDAIDSFARPAMLVIDEAQERSESAWEGVTLCSIIDERYSSRRDTLVLSNHSPNTLADSLGASIVDRARERVQL